MNIPNFPNLPNNLLINNADIAEQSTVTFFSTVLKSDFSITQVNAVLAQYSKLMSIQKTTIPSQLNFVVSPAKSLEVSQDFSNSINSVKNYLAQGETGNLGKYQINASTLEKLNYLKSGTSEKKSNIVSINDSSNWSGFNGINSKFDFLKNFFQQEFAISQLYEKNYQSLITSTSFFSTLTDSQKLGFLQVANISGVSAAISLYNFFIGKSVDLSKFDLEKITVATQYQAGFQASELSKKLK